MLKSAGFTIIELLMVITVIGVLAGVTLAVIDSQGQQARAEDGVKRADLAKAAESLETFFYAEGFYPDEGGSANNPLNGADSALVTFYIDIWPTEAAYHYDATINEFAIHVQKSTNQNFLKYRSTTAKIDECGETTDPNDVQDCDPI